MPSAVTSPPSAPSIPVRLLVIADQPGLVTAIAAALTPLDAEIVRVNGVSAALSGVLAQDFALIVVGAGRTESGAQIIRSIRAHRDHGHTPLLVLAAQAGGEAEAYRLGAVDVLGVTVAPEILRAKAAVFIALHRRIAIAASGSERERRLRWLVDHTSDAVWRFAADQPIPTDASPDEQIDLCYRHGFLAECNDAMARMYGFPSPAAMVGIRLSDMMPRSDERNLAYLRAFIAADYRLLDAESVERDREGNVKFLRNTLIAVAEDGHLRSAWGISRDITQRRKDEESLRLHALVLERMAEGVSVADADGLIRYTNAAADAMFGCSRGELAGTSLLAHSELTPDDQAKALGEILAQLAKEGSWTGEWRHRRKDGGAFITSVSIASIEQDGRRYLVCVQGDVTEQRRRLREIEESEAHTRALIDSALDAMITIDEIGVVTDWNPQAHAIFGWSRDEALGQSLAEMIIPPNLREAHRRGILRFHETGEGPILGRRLELAAVRRSGELFPVELSIVPSRIGGKQRFCGYLRDITERKRTEDELHQRERQLSLVIDALPALVCYVDDQRRYQLANRAYEEWFGIQPEQLLGRHMAEVIGGDAFALVESRISLALSGKRESFEGVLPYRDWAPRDIHADYMPDIDADGTVRGFVALVQDVSARKQAEAREHLLVEAIAVLNGSLDVDRTLMDLAAVVVPRLGDWCTIDLIDEGGPRRVAVVHRDPARARSLEDLLTADPGSREAIVARVAGKAAGEFVPEVGAEMSLLRSLGLGSFLAVPLRTRGRVVGVLSLASEGRRRLNDADHAFAQELADRTAAAIDNARLYQAEKTARGYAADRAEALARTNAELEQFAYVASHDLQEPLRMVLQFLELMRPKIEPHLDERTRSYMGFISEGATRMHALIHDLLAYSRLGREDTPPLQEIGLERVLAEALDNLSVSITSTGARISHGPLPVVRIDKVQLIQILQNLISNALKFRGAGIPEIAVTASDGHDHWTVKVADNGIGIDPAYHERIFEVFQRLHGRSEYPGTGIGLAIVKKAVERQNGRIWVESELGKGSTFAFTVPKAGNVLA
ncbi:MAG: PAS domain S-box protein [Planctomycetes bacterium]|nr:PAS domain S-box protein [Planctomycetota bacterium]